MYPLRSNHQKNLLLPLAMIGSTLKTEQNAQSVNHTHTTLWRIKPSTISTTWLKTLQPLHLSPINLVIYQGSYPINSVGDLISRRASHLDAFSGYPCQT